MLQLPSLVQHQYARVASIGGLVIADGLFFSNTRPEQLPIWGLFAAFALVGCTLFATFFYLLKLPEWYGFSLQRHRVRASLIGSVACCVLLAMSSVSQLSSRDMFVLALLAVVGYFYSHYAHRSKRSTI